MPPSPRSRRIGWAAFGLALVLHSAFVFTLVQRVEEKRRGRETPLPKVLLLFNDGAHRVGPGADFFALYHAAVRLERDGRIYGWGDDEITPPYYLYRYLPLLAQTAGRLARLVSPWTAYLVWLGLLEALLAACLFLIRRLFEDRPIVPWLWALWLAFTPLWLELFMGQFSFAAGGLVFVAGALGHLHARTDRPSRWALAPWIASVAIKVYPLVLLPLWWRKGLFVLSSALVVLVALANVPGFTTLPDTWSFFLGANLSPTRVIPSNAGHYGFSFVEQLVLVRGLGLRAHLWPIVHRVGTVVALGSALYFAARRRGAPLLAGIAALMLAHQVTYKEVWEHHYSMVLPMGVFLLHANLDRRRVAWAIGAALVVLALPTPFILWDRPGGDPANGWNLAQQIAVPGAKALPALFLFGVSLWTLARAPKTAVAEAPSAAPAVAWPVAETTKPRS